MHAAEQRKERESLEELIHSIQLESELTSRALKQSVSVSLSACLTDWQSDYNLDIGRDSLSVCLSGRL